MILRFISLEPLIVQVPCCDCIVAQIVVKEHIASCNINQMIISKNPQFTGISARQQLEFTTHLLLTD